MRGTGTCGRRNRRRGTCLSGAGGDFTTQCPVKLASGRVRKLPSMYFAPELLSGSRVGAQVPLWPGVPGRVRSLAFGAHAPLPGGMYSGCTLSGKSPIPQAARTRLAAVVSRARAVGPAPIFVCTRPSSLLTSSHPLVSVLRSTSAPMGSRAARKSAKKGKRGRHDERTRRGMKRF